jgi:hypothetical protein
MVNIREMQKGFFTLCSVMSLAGLYAMNEHNGYDAQILNEGSMWTICVYRLEDSFAVFIYWEMDILDD